ncbi:hypothetical protein F0U44_02715 [Nocardioides humilatus]|uniref:Uncharacterized protein n=1 Tax=Nocardioides humilatus TaxID=2607660 RepID=A0A5B1LKJ4_9ACTN|nr:hypothetical protein [Nocardioides humilatus]KAA1421241.1 hypothetical protein F0U44_02715 [Nocardioides humilatus]
MDLSEVLTLIVAVAALLVSLGTWLEQNRKQGQAHFTVEWDGRSVVFTNQGPGAAENVMADLANGGLESVSADYMGAFQSMRIYVGSAFGRPPGPLTVTWKDERRGQQTKVLPVPSRPESPPIRVATGNELEKAVRTMAAEVARHEIQQEATFRRQHGG